MCIYVHVKMGENGVTLKKWPFLITFYGKTMVFLKAVFPFSPSASIFTKKTLNCTHKIGQ